MKFPDRFFRMVTPLVAREARDNPAREWDDLLTLLLQQCASRGLRSVVAETRRVMAGAEPSQPGTLDINPRVASPAELVFDGSVSSLVVPARARSRPSPRALGR